MPTPEPLWPYLPTLARLALALALGLFVGIERERARKEAGLRTFAFASLLGAVGGLLGTPYAMLALALLGVLVILLNFETIRTGEGAEITTSAALLIMGFTGVLAGQGHTFTPTVLGVATAALLAWKGPLAGFSRALTERELRSAILLAIIAFIVYPVLPAGAIDPWHLIELRSVWVTVILIAALGFVNYILLKVYGARGIELTGFLGGLVNSTVTVTELAQRERESAGRLTDVVYRGIVLATAAMLVRNAVILALLAPSAALATLAPLLLMLAGAVGAALMRRAPSRERDDATALQSFESPFALRYALRFGLLFLGLQIAGALAQRLLGQAGFYTISILGGLVSSASAVGSAAVLQASGTISEHVAGVGAVLASITSTLVGIPLIARITGDQSLTRRVIWTLVAIAALGLIGAVAQELVLA